MGSTCDKTQIGVWNPPIKQGQTFNIPIQMAVNGVPGYHVDDSFVGWITDELESAAVLVDYTIDETDPVTGIITVSLTPAQTLALPGGLLYHDIEWTRSQNNDQVVSIGGRPNVTERGKA